MSENMDVLTKEQKEYIQLKVGAESMHQILKSLRKDGKIPPPCFDGLMEAPSMSINFMHEKYFCLLMEIMQGKQPRLLESIAEFHYKGIDLGSTVNKL